MGAYTEKLNLSKGEIKFIEKTLKRKRKSFGRREIMVLIALVMIPVIVCLIGIFLSPARVSFSFSDLWEYSKCPEIRLRHIGNFAVVIIFMFLLHISRDLKIAKGILKKIASLGILKVK